jgi:hypothetical protein
MEFSKKNQIWKNYERVQRTTNAILSKLTGTFLETNPSSQEPSQHRQIPVNINQNLAIFFPFFDSVGIKQFPAHNLHPKT